MAETKKLGELLKEAGLIDDFQLQSALSHQRNWGGKLGSVLVEKGFVREGDVARVIAQKLHFPYVDPFEPQIPEDVLRLLKPEIAKKYNAIPVRKEARALVVAMTDPLDIDATDALRFATGLNIKPALALESEIRDAIKKYYDGQSVDRKGVSSLPDIARSSTKMELVGSAGAEGRKTATATVSKSEETEPESEPIDYRIRVDALTGLLIEKGIITREELVKMISRKKMGQ